MKLLFTLLAISTYSFAALADGTLPTFTPNQKVQCLLDEDPRVGYVLTGLIDNKVQADIVVEGVITNPSNRPLVMSIMPLEEILSYKMYLYYERIETNRDIPMSVTIEILFPKEQPGKKINATAFISPAFAIQKPDGTYGVGESFDISILPMTCEIL